VFKHPAKKDLYIALADRWMGPLSGSDFQNGTTSRLVQSAFRKRFASPPQSLDADETQAFDKTGFLRINTSEARYVWLPIQFEADRPSIQWRSQWRLDEFE
jgi:hypothetical protein